MSRAWGPKGLRLEQEEAAPLPLFTELPRRGVLGNWVSGVQNSRKLNLCHYSFFETLYAGVLLCAGVWGYARMHQQLSGVWSSRKPACSRSDAYGIRTRAIACSVGFRLDAFSETGLPVYGNLGNQITPVL